MQGEEEASKLQSLSCYYRGDMSSAYLCITHLLEECWNVIFLDARDEAREGCRGWVGLEDGRGFCSRDPWIDCLACGVLGVLLDELTVGCHGLSSTVWKALPPRYAVIVWN